MHCSMRSAMRPTLLTAVGPAAARCGFVVVVARRGMATSPSRLRSSGASLASSSSTSPPSPSSSTSTSNSSKQRRRSFFTSSLLLSAGIFTGFAASLFPRPKVISLLFPAPTPIAPTAISSEGVEWTRRIEQGMQQLEIVRLLRQELDPAASGPAVLRWTESRPYAHSSPGAHSLSASTLRGPGKFAVAPLVFTNRERTVGIFLMHLGAGLCGHEGVVHGGLLATILDEALARTAFLGLPNQIGVTATLNISYKKPTFADQYVVVRTELVEVKGRKAWSKGRIESVDGEILVEAEGLFVEPKLAKFISKSSVREAMG